MAIVGFRHKGLRELYETGRSAKIGKPLHRKALLILDLLVNMAGPADCVGAWKFHALKGDRQGSYAFSVSGNYRITFRWQSGAARDVDFEDYH